MPGSLLLRNHITQQLTALLSSSREQHCTCWDVVHVSGDDAASALGEVTITPTRDLTLTLAARGRARARARVQGVRPADGEVAAGRSGIGKAIRPWHCLQQARSRQRHCGGSTSSAAPAGSHSASAWRMGRLLGHLGGLLGRLEAIYWALLQR
eukprot:4819614-Pyramimonas_sp.AAC.2